MIPEVDKKPQQALLWRDREEPEWMTGLRRRAFDEFMRTGWPSPQEEEWRRTDITALDFGKYKLLDSSKRPASIAAAGENAQIVGDAGQKLSGHVRFEGGECVECSLDAALSARGVRLSPLDQAIREKDSKIERVFAESLGRSANRFQSWHYSQWSHGVFLSIPEFVEIKEPFLFDFFEKGSDTFTAPHVIVLLEKGARAVVIERIRGGEEGDLLCNEGANITVGDGAGLELVRIQSLSTKVRYFNNAFASVSRDATFKHFEVAFGSRLYKSRFECSLDGPGSDVHLNGIYFAHKKQHMDIGTIQRHKSGHANSRAFYKGAVRDSARTIFQGLIEVAVGAEKTDAYLKNKNLILNSGARSDSIPMLKIDNNDVKCSHGSTTGRIDELQLFYLMSRGFSRAEAEKSLIAGFFEDVILEAHEAIRDELRQAIQERLE